MTDSQLIAMISLVSLYIQRCLNSLGSSVVKCPQVRQDITRILCVDFNMRLPITIQRWIMSSCYIWERKCVFSRTKFSNRINKLREKAMRILSLFCTIKKVPRQFEKFPIQHIKFEYQGELLREQNIHRACQLCESESLLPRTIF